jgi:hypothetical protein
VIDLTTENQQEGSDNDWSQAVASNSNIVGWFCCISLSGITYMTNTVFNKSSQ